MMDDKRQRAIIIMVGKAKCFILSDELEVYISLTVLSISFEKTFFIWRFILDGKIDL